MEIDKLVIKAEVDDSKKNDPKVHTREKEAEWEWLIERCIERIFQQLENRF